MRAILILSLLLSNVGWLAYHWGLSDESAGSSSPATSDQRWVRTQDGWERPSDWLPKPPLVRPALSPLVFGGVQLLASLVALLALSPSGGLPMGRRSEKAPASMPGAFESTTANESRSKQWAVQQSAHVKGNRMPPEKSGRDKLGKSDCN